MNLCLEIISPIIAIYPVRVGVFEFNVPFNVLATSFDDQDISCKDDQGNDEHFSIDLLNAMPGLVVESYSANDNARTLIIEDGPNVEDVTSVNAYGHDHKTTVKCRTLASPSEISEFAAALNLSFGTRYDIFVVDADYNIYVVRGDNTSVSIKTHFPSSGVSELSFDNISVNGLQRINTLSLSDSSF